MKKWLQKWMQKDLSVKWMLLTALALTAAKLLLTSFQLLLVTPGGAVIDDTLMYNLAQSIANGQWLGEYGWLTLSKHSFFSVWLALLHTLHIPYLLGGQLLQIAAAVAGAWAARPLLKTRKAKLFVYALLLWNPAASSAEVQLRVYRDNITPALAIFLFGGVIGCALRWRRPARESVGFALLAGAGLAAFYLNREDAAWVLPFAAVGAAVTLWFLWRGEKPQKTPGRVQKSLLLAVPFVCLGAGVLVYCALNNAYYGRFILSDFTSKEFNDAYGALTRVASEHPQEKIPVPRDVREKLYTLSPSFAALEPYLETTMKYNGYGSIPDREFNSGGFYWALRQAADEAGFYADAQTAKQYFETLAAEVNALCDTGAVQAGPPRSGTMPRIEARYIAPTLWEGVLNFGRVLTFAEAQPAHWTHMSEELSMNAELRAGVEAFLKSGTNWQAQAGTVLPYYSPLRQLVYRLLDAVRWVYAFLLPVGFVLALGWQVLFARRVFAKNAPALPCPTLARMVWLIQLGLLLSIFLRCCMIAFLFVASFNNVPHVMYLAAAHPLALLYAVLGISQFWEARAERRGAV